MKEIQARIDLADRAFRKLAKEYAARKAAAQKLVVEWRYAKRSIFDIRPADLKNIFESGVDAVGRIMVERQYTESARAFYETFYDWSTNPVEVSHYTYEPEKEPIFAMFAEMVDGRVVATWTAANMGLGYDIYHWEAGRCVRIDSHHAERAGGKLPRLRPFSITKAIYDAAGVLQRVANHSDEDDDDPEITYELRGEKAYWRKR